MPSTRFIPAEADLDLFGFPHRTVLFGRSLCEAAGGQQEERVQGHDPVHMLLGQHRRHRHPDWDGTQRGAPGPDARVSRWP